jgi:ABC-type phosphate transport system substrate-binding protein
LINKWQSIPGVTGTGNKGSIPIVYRTDSSGTSFAFTRYLAATCNGTTNVPSGFVFTPNSTFASAIPGGLTAVYGTRAIGASGNPGVVSAVLDAANPNALGYADVSEVIAEGAPYAIVNNFDPTQFGLVSGVPTPMTIAVTSLFTGRVLDGATADPVPGSGSPTINDCVRLVDPALVLSHGYPIVAVTYLAGYYNGNGTLGHVNAIKNLFDLPYNHVNRPVLPQGYAYLDGSAPFASSVKATVAACVNE